MLIIYRGINKLVLNDLYWINQIWIKSDKQIQCKSIVNFLNIQINLIFKETNPSEQIK